MIDSLDYLDYLDCQNQGYPLILFIMVKTFFCLNHDLLDCPDCQDFYCSNQGNPSILQIMVEFVVMHALEL